VFFSWWNRRDRMVKPMRPRPVDVWRRLPVGGTGYVTFSDIVHAPDDWGWTMKAL
jgi:hypothetical protein